MVDKSRVAKDLRQSGGGTQAPATLGDEPDAVGRLATATGGDERLHLVPLHLSQTACTAAVAARSKADARGDGFAYEPSYCSLVLACGMLCTRACGVLCMAAFTAAERCVIQSRRDRRRLSTSRAAASSSVLAASRLHRGRETSACVRVELLLPRPCLRRAVRR